jgi:hypothetical protein
MSGRPASIFRPDAVRDYARRREQAVLPPSISPSIVLCLWLVLAALAAGAIATLSLPVPVHVSGPATIIEWRDTANTVGQCTHRPGPKGTMAKTAAKAGLIPPLGGSSCHDRLRSGGFANSFTGQERREAPAVLAFLPVSSGVQPRAGQSLFITLAPGSGRLRQTIVAVEPGVYSPAAAQHSFDLPPGVVQALNGQSIVVVAPLAPLPSGLPTHAYLGGLYRAEIATDAQSLLSSLPLLGDGS